MAMHIIHIAWLFIYCTTSQAQGCRRTDSVKGYRLDGHVLTSQRESNIWSCIQTCKGQTVCQSINYNVETSICQINNRTKKGREDKVIAMNRSVYVDNPFRGKRNKIQIIIFNILICFIPN